MLDAMHGCSNLHETRRRNHVDYRDVIDSYTGTDTDINVNTISRKFETTFVQGAVKSENIKVLGPQK